MKITIIIIFSVFCFFESNCQVDTLYNTNGNIVSVGAMKNGEKVGVWYLSFKNGVPHHKIIYINRRELISEEYISEDFTQDIYIESNVLDATTIENNTLNLFRRSFIKIKKDTTLGVKGKVIYYYPDGSIAKKCRLKHGYHFGKVVTYYQSGKVGNIMHYSNNSTNGRFRAFYENGKLMVEGKYKEGARKGIWKEFFENGQLKLKGKYCTDIDPIKITGENKFQVIQKYPLLEDDILYIGCVVDFKSGLWEYFDKNGRLIKTEEYENGRLVESKEH